MEVGEFKQVVCSLFHGIGLTTLSFGEYNSQAGGLVISFDSWFLGQWHTAGGDLQPWFSGVGLLLGELVCQYC